MSGTVWKVIYGSTPTEKKSAMLIFADGPAALVEIQINDSCRRPPLGHGARRVPLE
jgi:hypothetical protein